jgi:hypothetical protein
VNEGSAKISVPNTIIKYGDSISLKWKGLKGFSETQNVVMIGVFVCGSWNGTSNIHIAHQHKQWGNNNVRYGFLTSGDCHNNPMHEYTVNKIYDCYFGKGKATVNGVALSSKSLGTVDCDGTTATILSCSPLTSACVSDIILRNEESVVNYQFVPCQHDNQAGMLDIISGTFHPNANTAGAFTIQLTDKTPA